MQQLGYFELIGFGAQGWGTLLIKAALMTVLVSVCGFVLGAILGAVLAWMKLQRKVCYRYFGDFYTTVFRGVPDLLIIYLIYFGGSSLVTNFAVFFGHDSFISLPIFLTGTLAIGIISAAYQTEVYRGAYLAIHKGELEAARAVGMHKWLRFRRIIAPQAIRLALPALGNTWQMVLKESALLSLIGLGELLWQSQVAAGSTRRPFDFYVTAAILYLVITAVSGFLFHCSEKRANHHLKGEG